MEGRVRGGGVVHVLGNNLAFHNGSFPLCCRNDRRALLLAAAQAAAVAQPAAQTAAQVAADCSASAAIHKECKYDYAPNNHANDPEHSDKLIRHATGKKL